MVNKSISKEKLVISNSDNPLSIELSTLDLWSYLEIADRRYRWETIARQYESLY